MEKLKYAIIGGGASGLMLANALCAHPNTDKPTVFERLDRVGKKLSATGNGQGNITNLNALSEAYFTSSEDKMLVKKIVSAYDNHSLQEWFSALGIPLCADERGRVYPAGRQASALTDALRFSLSQKGADIRLGARVTDMKKTENGFLLTYLQNGAEKTCFAEKVALCAGGKAAKNFGTDGTAYALAERCGHSVTPLYPSLVQLKTDTAHTKTLKGIRITDGELTASAPSGEYRVKGDIIFTDYGVSGDAVFRISAFIAREIASGKVCLSIDFLPELGAERIYEMLLQKRRAFPALETGELLFGIVNNQVGRAVIKRAAGDLKKAAELVKAFPLTVTGSLGFDYAQVTKGGIPLSEVTDGLESRFAKGLYLAGEILDVDGQCGGYNLQWAYSSARRVAEEIGKDRGQV